MHTLTRSVRFTLAAALLVPCLALGWFMAVPDTLTPFNYLLLAGLLTALAAVAVTTYRNTQETGSMAQILHEADIAPSATTSVGGGRPRSRPQP
jgi:hypothetical protein